MAAKPQLLGDKYTNSLNKTKIAKQILKVPHEKQMLHRKNDFYTITTANRSVTKNRKLIGWEFSQKEWGNDWMNWLVI